MNLNLKLSFCRPRSNWRVLAGILAFFLARLAPGQIYERLAVFETELSKPRGLVLGTDGCFYGTTTNGSFASGGVFKMTTSGVITVLAGFTGPNAPQNPVGSLVRGGDGSFYGVTNQGGVNSLGTVFKVTSSGSIATLASFDGTNGRIPRAGLVQGSDGNFYGTAYTGGANGYGTVYKITSTGTLTTLASFNYTNGAYPEGVLVEGSDGNFYGTTSKGGTSDLGTIFKISPAGVLTSLVSIPGSTAGRTANWHQAGLAPGVDGNFYGTTCHGGSANLGAFFRVTPSGVFTTLASFSGATGERPMVALTPTNGGDFYGITSDPGTTSGSGTIFKVTTSGALTILASLDGGANGEGSEPLVEGDDGNFYGTSYNAGTITEGLLGRIYRVTPSGLLTTVFSFSYGSGRSPSSGLTAGLDGNYYGCAFNGGTYDYGTLYKITPTGVLSTLVTFNFSNGRYPQGELLRRTDGNFYGATYWGGTSDCGTLFKVTPAGVLTTLASFNGTNGKSPTGITEGSDGNFYGLTSYGGSSDLGTVYKMSPAGAITTLVTFSGANGNRPYAGLVESGGEFYGTTLYGGTAGLGTLFKVSPTGTLTTLVNFSGSNGSYPTCTLVRANDGALYGTTQGGGTGNFGTVFKITGGATHSIVAAFSGTNGATPIAGLIQGRDGNFYGTTALGGSATYGTVFRMTTDGTITTLFDFASDPQATQANSPLLEASEGIYGVTTSSLIRLVTQGPPVADVSGATSIRSTAATIQGRVNARGLSTSVTFQYGTSPGALSNTVFAAPSPINDYFVRPVAVGLSGLSAETTYYYRLQATNSAGTATTAVQSFTTQALPKATTLPGTNLSPTSATLNGLASGSGLAASVLIEYGTDGLTYPNNITPTPASVTGTANTPVLATITGLQPGATYYYRLVVTSSAGTSSSAPASFITLTQPVVASIGAATGVTTNGATLSGIINARGTTTTAIFEYSTDAAFPVANTQSQQVAQNPIGGTADTTVSSTLSGLAQGTTYFYRLHASSAGGDAAPSSPVSFTTLSLPVASDLAAPSVDATVATLQAKVDPNGLDTLVTFEYGPGPVSFPFSVTSSPALVTGDGFTVVRAVVSGLQPETSYYFRVRATSAAGEQLSPVLNFIMAPAARAVTGAGSATLGAKSVEAILSGTVNGFGQPTSVSFEYGTSPTSLDRTIGAAPATVTGSSDTPVSANLSELLQGTTYYFRVKAGNAGGTAPGAVQQFTTPSKAGLVARDSFIFYAGAILMAPLRDVDDPDANPLGDKSRLSIDPVLVQPPTVSQNVATVQDDRKTIDYRPQFNVKEVDTLIYRVTDAFGNEATPTVNLITFTSRSGFYNGGIEDAINAPGHRGALSLQLGGAGAISTSFVSWTGENYRLKGVFDQFGELRATFTSRIDPNMKLSLKLALDHEAKTIQGSLVESTNGLETARVAAFTLFLNAGTGGLPESGSRTGFLTPPAEVVDQMGDGYVLMTVPKNRRSARFVGQMPDGEPFSTSVRAEGRSFSLLKPLENGGLLTGLVHDVGSEGDNAGIMANLFWQKRANSRSRYYRNALETNLELLGMKYPVLGASDQPPIGLGTSNPNARLLISGSDVPPVDLSLQIQAGRVSGIDPRQLQLKLQPSLGTFSGQFKHPGTGQFVPFRGAFRVPLDTDPGQGQGVFRSSGRAGSVRILPTP